MTFKWTWISVKNYWINAWMFSSNLHKPVPNILVLYRAWVQHWTRVIYVVKNVKDSLVCLNLLHNTFSQRVDLDTRESQPNLLTLHCYLLLQFTKNSGPEYTTSRKVDFLSWTCLVWRDIYANCCFTCLSVAHLKKCKPYPLGLFSPNANKFLLLLGANFSKYCTLSYLPHFSNFQIFKISLAIQVLCSPWAIVK